MLRMSPPLDLFFFPSEPRPTRWRADHRPEFFSSELVSGATELLLARPWLALIIVPVAEGILGQGEYCDVMPSDLMCDFERIFPAAFICAY